MWEASVAQTVIQRQWLTEYILPINTTYNTNMPLPAYTLSTTQMINTVALCLPTNCNWNMSWIKIQKKIVTLYFFMIFSFLTLLLHYFVLKPIDCFSVSSTVIETVQIKHMTFDWVSLHRPLWFGFLFLFLHSFNEPWSVEWVQFLWKKHKNMLISWHSQLCKLLNLGANSVAVCTYRNINLLSQIRSHIICYTLHSLTFTFLCFINIWFWHKLFYPFHDTQKTYMSITHLTGNKFNNLQTHMNKIQLNIYTPADVSLIQRAWESQTCGHKQCYTHYTSGCLGRSIRTEPWQSLSPETQGFCVVTFSLSSPLQTSSNPREADSLIQLKLTYITNTKQKVYIEIK